MTPAETPEIMLHPNEARLHLANGTLAELDEPSTAVEGRLRKRRRRSPTAPPRRHRGGARLTMADFSRITGAPIDRARLDRTVDRDDPDDARRIAGDAARFRLAAA